MTLTSSPIQLRDPVPSPNPSDGTPNLRMDTIPRERKLYNRGKIRQNEDCHQMEATLETNLETEGEGGNEN